MTLEELADLIRANSANTNGRIDGLRNEFNAALMNIQNDLTDLRADVKAGRDDLSGVRSDVAALKADMAGVKSTLDLAGAVVALRHQFEALAAEVAELKRRAS